MNKPHKHAELIKAWADGAEIEVKVTEGSEWKTFIGNETPSFDVRFEYRIKPEPKPDVAKLYAVMVGGGIYEAFKTNCSNLKLTFDGETGELKYAEVLK